MALFFLMAAGFALGKSKIVDSSAIRGMSNLIVKASLPALIVMSLQKPFTKELFRESLKTLLVAAGFYAGIIVISLVAARLLRVNRKKSGSIAFSLSFSNAAFIGFPVITSILGQEALFLTAIHNIMFNILAFSLGILVIAGDFAGKQVDGEGRKKLALPIKSVFNINVIATLAGFALFVFSITIPHALALPLTMLGGLTTPLAMIVTGAMLARTPVRAVVGDWKLYVVTALRLVGWPAITALALTLAGVEGQLKYITIIIAGMPAASNTSLLAEVYGGDTDTSSSIIFMTTLLSVASIPILALALA